jgi:hypothetical protein
MVPIPTTPICKDTINEKTIQGKNQTFLYFLKKNCHKKLPIMLKNTFFLKDFFSYLLETFFVYSNIVYFINSSANNDQCNTDK